MQMADSVRDSPCGRYMLNLFAKHNIRLQSDETYDINFEKLMKVWMEWCPPSARSTLPAASQLNVSLVRSLTPQIPDPWHPLHRFFAVVKRYPVDRSPPASYFHAAANFLFLVHSIQQNNLHRSTMILERAQEYQRRYSSANMHNDADHDEKRQDVLGWLLYRIYTYNGLSKFPLHVDSMSGSPCLLDHHRGSNEQSEAVPMDTSGECGVCQRCGTNL